MFRMGNKPVCIVLLVAIGALVGGCPVSGGGPGGGSGSGERTATDGYLIYEYRVNEVGLECAVVYQMSSPLSSAPTPPPGSDAFGGVFGLDPESFCFEIGLFSSSDWSGSVSETIAATPGGDVYELRDGEFVRLNEGWTFFDDTAFTTTVTFPGQTTSDGYLLESWLEIYFAF